MIPVVLDFAALVAMICLSALFMLGVSAVALTVVFWFIGVHVWAKISGRPDV